MEIYTCKTGYPLINIINDNEKYKITQKRYFSSKQEDDEKYY